MKCGATQVEMSDGTIIESQKTMREFILSHGFDVKVKKLVAPFSRLLGLFNFRHRLQM